MGNVGAVFWFEWKRAMSLTRRLWWLALAAFAGLYMLQAAFTGFCPAAIVFKRLGVRCGTAFN